MYGICEQKAVTDLRRFVLVSVRGFMLPRKSLMMVDRARPNHQMRRSLHSVVGRGL